MQEIYDTNGILVKLEGSPVILVDEEKGIYKAEEPFIIDVIDWMEDESNYGYSALISTEGISREEYDKDMALACYVTKKVKQYELYKFSQEIGLDDKKHECVSCIFHDRPIVGYLL